MAATTRKLAVLQDYCLDLMHENAELKTLVIEKDELIARKDELIARLRREVNSAYHKAAKLQQMVDPEIFLATR